MSGITGFLEIQPNELSTIRLPRQYNPLESAESTSELKHYLGVLALQNSSTGEGSVDEGLKNLQEADLPRSNYTLGIIYLKGLYGQAPNEKLAIDYLDRAAKAGSDSAKVAIGYIYWKGFGGTAASDSLAMHYLDPHTVQRVHDLSEELLLELQTFAVDHYEPSLVWDSSLFSRKSSKRDELAELKLSLADKEIAKSAGSPHVNDLVAVIWESVKQSFAKGEKLPSKMIAAVTQLGCYFYSRPCTNGTWFNGKMGGYYWKSKLAEKAVALWTEAANSGDIQAKYYLALACCSGKGMHKGKKDLARGKALLKEAADLGYPPAATMLNYLETKPSKRVADKEVLAEIQNDKFDNVDFGSKPEKHCIAANRSFLNKAWSWIKKPSRVGILVGALIGIAAAVGAVAGLVFLAIQFPLIILAPLCIAAVVTIACTTNL